MSEPQHEAELTLKDRLNFPYLLANQILTVQKSILISDDTAVSQREIMEAIQCLVHLIPESWKDKDFKNECEKAEVTHEIDVRPTFCGMSAPVDVCEKLGVPTMREIKSYDYFKLFQACMNLLQRKQMLTKIQRVEKLEGIDFDEAIKEYTVVEG